MRSSFFTLDGFFVCWKMSDGQLCKVKAPNEEQAKWLTELLCKKLGVNYADR